VTLVNVETTNTQPVNIQPVGLPEPAPTAVNDPTQTAPSKQATDAPKQSETTKQILAQGVRLVGLPLTLAGLFRVIEDLEKRSKVTDNLLASVAIIFLVSWIAAFLSVRPNQTAGRTLEQLSTTLFYLGLTAMVILIGLMVFGV
jgi:hypothetical protein